MYKKNELKWKGLSFTFLFMKFPHLQSIQGRMTSLKYMRTKGFQIN